MEIKLRAMQLSFSATMTVRYCRIFFCRPALTLLTKQVSMETANKKISIGTEINLPVAKVWDYFSLPEHIIHWNNASDEWHTPSATNDLRTGGSFTSTMAAKDGSASFDFSGTYTDVKDHELIEYKLGDDRVVTIRFSEENGLTKIDETFDAESTHEAELQRSGWQAILDNFKRYAEQKG